MAIVSKRVDIWYNKLWLWSNTCININIHMHSYRILKNIVYLKVSYAFWLCLYKTLTIQIYVQGLITNSEI